jgi:hypothetical protein
MTLREGDPNFPTNLDIVPSTPGALRLGSQGRSGEVERIEDDGESVSALQRCNLTVKETR